MFNKDLGEIKKSQSIMNNARTETRSTLEGTNSRITEAEERISEVEDRMVACQGFLVGGACVYVLVGRAEFLLSGVQ